MATRFAFGISGFSRSTSICALVTLGLILNAAGDLRGDELYAHGVVAADHPAASAAGLQILQQGGNVVDAAIAASFALSVVRPASCGLGGGGFMVIWNAKTQQATALDYRETAPKAATRELFTKHHGPEPDSVRGGLAIGVPGTVAGLCYAARHHGSLPLATLLAPAIRLASDGVEVDEHERAMQRHALATINRHKGYGERFSTLLHLYLNDGVAWKSGDRFYSPQLRLLRLIAESGPDAFYRGPVADAIVQTAAADGGILTSEDLAEFSTRRRQPVRGRFRDVEILSMPPPSSGGIALIQTLQTLEQWETAHDLRLQDLKHNSADYVHVVAEAMKHAFADRAQYLGDTDFVDVPVTDLLSAEHARKAALTINRREVLPADDYGRFFNGDDSGTSHISVIDTKGNAVSCTETINLAYGSFAVVPKFGLVLNNEMDDFAAQPGKPNAFGLLQSEANAIEPGKKPLSSMSPTIVVRDGRAEFVSGASGGPRIISATLQVILNHLLFGMSPGQSVEAARFHHQWHPNTLRLESAFGASVRAALKDRGHRLQPLPLPGANQAASATAGGLRGGSDPRKHGRPAGY